MVIFRADGNKELGSGHIMRCLSIAKVFLAHGQECVFATADHQGDPLLDRAGIPHVCLNSAWKNPESEIKDFLEMIRSCHPKCVVLDHYFSTSVYRDAIRSQTKLVCLAPLTNLDCHCDVLINYKLGAKNEIYSKDVGTLLLGPSYTPLREEFSGKGKKDIKQQVKHVLVSAGGSDPLGILMQIMSMVSSNCHWSHVAFHFIVGALNPYMEEMKKIRHKNENIIIHQNVEGMSEIMELCDMAIAAAGTTLFELCACGVPTIAYILADNQIKMADDFAGLGLMLNNGDCRKEKNFIWNLQEKVELLLGDFAMRSFMSRNMQMLVDGKGAKRIVQAILEETK